MIYSVYHIFGKKVGVTNDIESRVIHQQGYNEDEFEILEMSEDITYISNRELFWQKAFGYRVDDKLYKDLFNNNETKLNNMKINVTEATTTFPCPINKLKGRLMDELGMTWQTDHGEFTITNQTINWIMANVNTSMYNKDRCYVYNKAFKKFYEGNPHRNITIGTTHDADVERINKKHFGNERELIDRYMGAPSCNDCDENIFDCIRDWADERGLYDKGDAKTQYIKLMEETGEIGRAILKNDTDEIIDGIGDAVVVLTNLAELVGVPIEECIKEAYDVISKRTGKMVNGTFVKDQPVTSYGRANVTKRSL
ncbi:MazG-like family protein [bacterium]|nr:MazG-like family protein [bacterium]